MKLARAGVILLVLAIPVIAQPPGGGNRGSFMMQFKGGGPGGMMSMMGGNPDDLFNQFSKGKDVIRRDDLDPMAQMFFDRATRQMNITNGQITRAQFKDAFSQVQARMQNGGGPGNMGGPPSAEMQDRFAEQRFRSYDKNNDGLLSSEEMPEALRNERDKWDANKDGFIDLNEFKGYFKSRFEQRNDRPEAASPSQDQTNTTTLPGQEPVFNLDRPTVFRAGHLPKELPDWFKQLDTDNDGQVGLYEWVRGGKSISEFRDMDISDDGFIIAEEVLRVQRGNRPAGTTSVASNGGSMIESIGSMMMNNATSAPSFRGGNGNRGGDANNGSNNWNRWMGMGGDRSKGGERGKDGNGSRRPFGNGGERPKGVERSKDARSGN